MHSMERSGGGNLVLSAAEFCFCLGGHTWQKTTGCASAGPRAYVIRAHVHMHARIRSGSKLLCREIFCFSRETTQVLAFDGVSTFELCWLGLRPQKIYFVRSINLSPTFLRTMVPLTS